MELFNPRTARAPATQSMTSKSNASKIINTADSLSSGRSFCPSPSVLPLKNAEAEAVCGTHLYAYLQEVFFLVCTGIRC